MLEKQITSVGLQWASHTMAKVVAEETLAPPCKYGGLDLRNTSAEEMMKVLYCIGLLCTKEDRVYSQNGTEIQVYSVDKLSNCVFNV